MMRYAFLIFLVSCIAGCTKEEITLYYASIKNTTSHQVEIRPYTGGSVVSANIITLSPNEEIEIANGFIRGISANSGFGSRYFSNADSLIVIFDGTYKITHYFETPVVFAPNYYLYTSLRNLGNKDSYLFEGTNLSKYKRKNTYLYIISDQDYLDAL